MEQVRNLIVQIPGRKACQAEGGTRANTQKQKHFLGYLRRRRRTVVWSRMSEEVVAGEGIREESEAYGPIEILEGIIGYSEEKNGKPLQSFEHRSAIILFIWTLDTFSK